MKIHRIAAFSTGGEGGNPAGVVILEEPATDARMREVAAEVGYSETAFAHPQDGQSGSWRVRYFSPETEVPFCGHATLALGAVLARREGPGLYRLDLNEASITVEAETSGEGIRATLSSPPTASRPATETEVTDAMTLFGLNQDDLDPRLPPAHIHAGADHIVLVLAERKRLAAMEYDIALGREVMRRHRLVTIMLAYAHGHQSFAARNAFASGGVFEDPATGAAAAAFAGYLRDRDWPHGGRISIAQGEDMGSPSVIEIEMTGAPGSSIRVSGATRIIPDP